MGQAFVVWPDRPEDGTDPLLWTAFDAAVGWRPAQVAVADLGTSVSWTREDFRLAAGGDGAAAVSWKNGPLHVARLEP